MDEGLETKHVLSVGRKPPPLKEILDPVPLKKIVGADSTLRNVTLTVIIKNAQTRRATMTLMDDYSNAITSNY